MFPLFRSSRIFVPRASPFTVRWRCRHLVTPKLLRTTTHLASRRILTTHDSWPTPMGPHNPTQFAWLGGRSSRDSCNFAGCVGDVWDTLRLEKKTGVTHNDKNKRNNSSNNSSNNNNSSKSNKNKKPKKQLLLKRYGTGKYSWGHTLQVQLASFRCVFIVISSAITFPTSKEIFALKTRPFPSKTHQNTAFMVIWVLGIYWDAFRFRDYPSGTN